MQLVVANLAKAFGAQEVFKDISFMIEKGERVGLIGVNGSGKSTLVNCLLNPDWADGGTVSFEPGLRVGHVEQGFASIKDESIWEFMLHSCPEILQLRIRLAELEKEISTGAENVLQEYARTTQLYEHLDGYGYESRLKRVLLGLAFPEATWEHNALELSGGQKTRMMLAAALVSAPDFLILDEPTNNLDMQMMEWLEGYLQEFKGGLLIVSHDRAFLDHVTTRILEMEKGHLQSFTGNYSRYLEQKALQVKTETAAYNAQQDFIAAQEAYILRFKAGIKSKMARGRQSRLDRLERLDAPVENEEFNLRLPPATEAAERILIMEDLNVGYGNQTLLKDLNLTLRRGEKVALIGPNGTGKTTLLKTLLGLLPPLHGKAQIGNRVSWGIFPKVMSGSIPSRPY
jgi:ATP-binding cassette subfamily F protein 3